MRTLFAKFLFWFWVGLAVLLGLELLFETSTLEKGLEIRSGTREGGLALVSSLARATLAEGGLPAVGRLLRRLDHEASIEGFVVDSLGEPVADSRAPAAARAAGRASLAQSRTILVESPGGFYVGSPLGAVRGRRVSLVLHLRPGTGDEGAHLGPLGWLELIPFDLGVRALAALLLGGVGCYLLARSITAPVSRLREATRRLAAGDLHARVGSANPRRRDELEDLGRDFDRMAERLDALVGAERRLLSDISHELRSPLARMNVALELMRGGDAADVAAMMPRLQLEAARLDQLIGDVLTLSRAEAGEPVPDQERVDLVELVSEVVEDARFEAAPLSKTVQLDCRASALVAGEPELLRSAVDNVVRNAVRHTAPNTSVDVTVGELRAAGRGTATIVVRDHGPGLPADQLERIFEPFYRAPTEPGVAPQGSGLGLAIARRVMTRHGGSIDASPAEGGGLAVTIRLPAA